MSLADMKPLVAFQAFFQSWSEVSGCSWEKPWAFTMPLKRDTEDGGLFEYACHEGNRGLHNILSAARAEEAGAAKK